MWTSRQPITDPPNRSYRTHAIVAGLLAVGLAVGAGALMVNRSDTSASSSTVEATGPNATNPTTQSPTTAGPTTQNPTSATPSSGAAGPSRTSVSSSGASSPSVVPADDVSGIRDDDPAAPASSDDADPAGSDAPAAPGAPRGPGVHLPPLAIPLPDLEIDPEALARSIDIVPPTIDAHFDADSIQDVAPGMASCPGHPGTTRSRLIVHVTDAAGVASVTETVTYDGHSTTHSLIRLGGDAWDGEEFGGFALSEARGRWILGVRIDARDNRGNLSSQLALITVVPCH